MKANRAKDWCAIIHDAFRADLAEAEAMLKRDRAFFARRQGSMLRAIGDDTLSQCETAYASCEAFREAIAEADSIHECDSAAAACLSQLKRCGPFIMGRSRAALACLAQSWKVCELIDGRDLGNEILAMAMDLMDGPNAVGILADALEDRGLAAAAAAAGKARDLVPHAASCA